MGVLNFRGGITSASLGEGCFLCRSGSGLIVGWVAYTMGGRGVFYSLKHYYIMQWVQHSKALFNGYAI